MTPQSVRFHPEAISEAEAAVAWYSDRSPRAAEMFLQELDRAISQTVNSPSRFPTYAADTRRVKLRRFPYLVVFRQSADGIEIIAVAHGHRRPNYWRDRTA